MSPLTYIKKAGLPFIRQACRKIVYGQLMFYCLLLHIYYLTVFTLFVVPSAYFITLMYNPFCASLTLLPERS